MRKLTLCIYLLLSVTSPLSSALAGPLHDAAFIGDIKEVRRLIADGANVNEKDSDGRTPLHAAALNNRMDVAELLIVNGARVNAKDKQRRTPLQWAVYSRHENMVRLLKRHGAKDRAKWKEITEDEAKLIFYWPGADEPRVIRKRRKASANTVLTETGHWQARGRDWPRAVLFLQELATDLQYTDNRTLTEVTKKSLPNATIIATGDREESYNSIGRVELQRFTRDSSIECVALRQYTGYTAKTFLQDQGLGDTLIYGWYCTARHAALTEADVRNLVQGIGVKGIALPERPAPSVKDRMGEQPSVVVAHFTTGIIGTLPKDSLSEISLKEDRIILWVQLRIPRGTHAMRIRIFDGSGHEIWTGNWWISPTFEVWSTWYPYGFHKSTDKPGRWKFELFVDERKVLEEKLTVHPA